MRRDESYESCDSAGRRGDTARSVPDENRGGMFRVYDGIRRGSGACVRRRSLHYAARRDGGGQMFSIFKNTCTTICVPRDILAPPRPAPPCLARSGNPTAASTLVASVETFTLKNIDSLSYLVLMTLSGVASRLDFE